MIRIFPNTGSSYRLVGALCAETHEEWSTVVHGRYLNMDEYFRWRAYQWDKEALDEETLLDGELPPQLAAVPA